MSDDFPYGLPEGGPEGFSNPILWHNWYYLDDDGEAVKCECLEDMQKKWTLDDGETLGHNPIYIVGNDQIGRYRVSTVFLGLDHAWGDGPPVLWETMIFGNGMFDCWQDRTEGKRALAQIQHKLAVDMLKQSTWKQEWHYGREEGFETYNWDGPPEFMDCVWHFAKLVDESFCRWYERTFYAVCDWFDETFNDSLYPWELASSPQRKKTREGRERHQHNQKYLKLQGKLYKMSLFFAAIAFVASLFPFNPVALVWIFIAVLWMNGSRRTDIQRKEIEELLEERIELQDSMIEQSHKSFEEMSETMMKMLRSDDQDKN